MAGLRMMLSHLKNGKIGSSIALFAIVLWTLSLPFAMAQTVRFTSIFLFSVVGGFLISLLESRADFFSISKRQFLRMLPLSLLAILPLLHYLPNGSNQRELLLLLPLLVLPWILLSFRKVWPGFMPKLLFSTLLASWILLCMLQLFRGPVLVWQSVRSESEIPDLFLLARPQFGLLTGLIFFLTAHFIPLRKGWYIAAALATLLFLFWILAKIAFISFLLVLMFLFLFDLRKAPMRFIPAVSLLTLAFIAAFYFFVSSGFVSEALSRDGLSFERYPKAYVNSINSRVVLWKASLQLLCEDNNWIAGLPSEKLGPALDEKVGRLNSCLQTWHLNPHNQPLYILLHYGIPGLLALIFFWLQVFRMVRSSRALTGLWLFVLACSMTEIYLDREFGTQLFLLAFILSAWQIPELNSKPKSAYAA